MLYLSHESGKKHSLCIYSAVQRRHLVYRVDHEYQATYHRSQRGKRSQANPWQRPLHLGVSGNLPKQRRCSSPRDSNQETIPGRKTNLNKRGPGGASSLSSLFISLLLICLFYVGAGARLEHAAVSQLKADYIPHFVFLFRFGYIQD